MHNALLVEVVQGEEELPHVEGRLRVGQAPARLLPQVPAEVPAAREGHDDEDCFVWSWLVG